MIVDKNNIIPNLVHSGSPVIIDIGCGNHKKNPNWIGIDFLDYDCVDIVGDIFEVLKAMSDNSVDEVYASHFFEHIGDIKRLLGEIERVLKKNGKINIIVPHFSNPYFYSDYTHTLFFGLYSFCYLTNSSLFIRKVPTYQNVTSLELTNVHLGFKSPFYLTYAIRRFILQPIFNSSNFIKEIYENSFCYVFPCYELTYSITKK